MFIATRAGVMVRKGESDPNFANVTLLLPFDSGFQDASGLSQTLSVLNGTPTTSTSIKQFGAAAGDFRRTGSLSVPSGMDFGTGDFTVECWTYWRTSSGVSQWGLFQLSTPGATYNITTSNLAVLAGSAGYSFYFGGPVNTTVAIQNTTWQHLAISRQAGTVRVFVNGNNIHQFNSSFNFANAGGVIGGYYDNTYNADALLDEFRVTKGVARYTANFTPPTAAFPRS